ncbi:MAG: hypothetical protein ACWA5Q_03820 [bacterium]
MRFSILLLGWMVAVGAQAGVLYRVDATATIESVEYHGTGVLDIDPAFLGPNTLITFDSGGILNFEFTFENMVIPPVEVINPEAEGVMTDATGEVVSFFDGGAGSGRVYVSFWNDFGISGIDNNSVAFHESTPEFRYRQAGDSQTTGVGTYSIRRLITEPPEPVPLMSGFSLAILMLLIGIGARRGHARQA